MAAKDTITRILITAKDEASGVFGSLQRNAGKVAAAVAGYFSVKLFGDSARSAENLDVQMRKLEGVIEATGGAAGLTATEIDEMARRLDEATLGSAAGFRDAAAQLLTFKSIGKDSFETVLGLAQDLSANGFGDLKSTTLQLGKALENPVKGLTALSRSGVTFTEQQQSLIKSLVDTGRAADAQGIILQAVAGQVGGVAQAMGGGLSGAVDLVGKRFTDLKEQLGAAVLPVFTVFNNRLADLYKRLTDSGAVRTFGEAVGSAMDAASAAFFRFTDSFDLNAIIASLQSWATTTKETVEQWAGYLSTASDVASTAFNAISAGINTIKTAFFGAAGVIADFASNVTGGMATVLETMASVLPRFKNAADEARAISDGFAESARVNYEKASNALDDTAASADKLRGSFSNLVGATGGAATSLDAVDKSTLELQKHLYLTADQLDALGNNMEYVEGASRGAATGIDATADSADKLAGGLDAAVAESIALADAFKLLKVDSSASLNETAAEARAAFETIRNSGTASVRDIRAAFTAYAQSAIAANDGVASATLKAEGRMVGLKVEADETGKAIVSAMFAAAGATDEVGDAADRATGSVRGLRNELEGLRKDQQDGDVDPVNNVVQRRDPRSAPGESGTDLARARGIGVDYEDVDELDKAFNEAFAKKHAELMKRYSTTTNVSRDKYIKDMQRIEQAALAESLQRIKDSAKEEIASSTTQPQKSSGSSRSGISPSVGRTSGRETSAPGGLGFVTINVGGRSRKVPTTSGGARELVAALQEIEGRT